MKTDKISQLRKRLGDSTLLDVMIQVMPSFWLKETIKEVERLMPQND